MSDTLASTQETDPSGLFNTYKSHPVEHEESTTSVPTPCIPEVEKRWDMSRKSVSPIDIPRYETTFQKSMYLIQIIINGCVRVVKVVLWGILWLGGLFIAALATNTLNQAVDIINASLLSKIWTSLTLSSEVSIKNEEWKVPVTGLSSNALSSETQNNTPSATSEALVAKRRAILEARKAAKALEEKQKAAEQIQ